MSGIFRAFDFEADRGVRRHGFEGDADQQGELVFERMGAGHGYKEGGVIAPSVFEWVARDYMRRTQGLKTRVF